MTKSSYNNNGSQPNSGANSNLHSGRNLGNYIGQSPGIIGMNSIQEENFDDDQFIGEGQNAQVSKITEHYEVPNMTSMLYEYTNKEQDRIHQSFRVGNYISLRDIPNSILPGNVSSMQTSKQEENLYSIVERRSWVELAKNGGYFSKFAWQNDPYERYREDQTRRRLEHEKNQQQVHKGAPFLGMPHRQIPHKHESYFQSLQFQPYDSVAIGFLSEDDPYEANAFEVLRAKWINDSKMLYGDFKFSQADQSLKGPNKQDLADMVGYIKRNLLTDWSDINFIIGSNPEDYIEIRFDNESIDAPKGLHAYMNTLVNTTDILIKYRLRRIVRYWGLESQDKQYIYYMLGPPWAKHKNPILYLEQFPQ